jgi:hypothetical protein
MNTSKAEEFGRFDRREPLHLDSDVVKIVKIKLQQCQAVQAQNDFLGFALQTSVFSRP